METPWPPQIGKETPLITPKNALDIVVECARPLGTVREPLLEALGYRLAEDVVADRDMPPADCSIMDGYAVRSPALPKWRCEARPSVRQAAAQMTSRCVTCRGKGTEC
jgi:molybdopterin biosynthesis enzyme